MAEELLTRSKQGLADLSGALGKEIEIRARPGMHQEQFELLVLEPGPPAEIELSWLQSRHPDSPGDRPDKSRRGRRRRGGRGRDGGGDSDAAMDAGEAGGEADLLGDEIEETIDALDDGVEAGVEDGLGEVTGDACEVAALASPAAGADAKEEGETLQPVDGEVESRILPRSE